MRFPVSVKGVLFSESKVVLLENERSEWELPGGKLDTGEAPSQCVRNRAATGRGRPGLGADRDAGAGRADPAVAGPLRFPHRIAGARLTVRLSPGMARMT
ncbi:NUDIX domain-containing protein [Phaeospirillum tilakii]|uniref:NUDIX domain-containing protein n=1 Tax=Phaeospirillum tilakii TaxID=741673 RepID=A0ABW5CH67_9PROT